MTMPWIFGYEAAEGGDELCSPTSSTSETTSSIGKNSDLSASESPEGEDLKEESEVQSAYKGKQGLMDDLEEALPFRKGISEFYNGKSKSFACLNEALCTGSIKGISKAENAYSRRSRNLMAFNHAWSNKNRKINGGAISKKPIVRRSVAPPPGVALSICESINSSNSDSVSNPSDSNPNLNSSASFTSLVSLSSLRQNVPRRRSISLPQLHLPLFD